MVDGSGEKLGRGDDSAPVPEVESPVPSIRLTERGEDIRRTVLLANIVAYDIVSGAAQAQADFEEHLRRNATARGDTANRAMRSSRQVTNVEVRVLEGGTHRDLTRAEYDELIRAAGPYDLIIDGVGSIALLRNPDGSRRSRSLSQNELTLVERYMLSGKRMTPLRAVPGICATEVAAVKLFESARRKVDFRLEGKRYIWRAFHWFRAESGSAKEFQFRPPGDYRYCLISPLSSSPEASTE